MTKNVEKKTLNEYLDMNSIALAEIDEEKKNYNAKAMSDDSMSKALLELEVQRLSAELEETKRDSKSLNKLVDTLTNDNRLLKEKYKELFDTVNEHLNYVVNSLEIYDEEHATFIGKFAHKLCVKRLKKKTKEMLKKSGDLA